MKRIYVVITMLCALLFACKPETEKPTVVTKSVEDVTETTAKVVGEVVEDGGAEVSERGVCWNKEGDPGIKNHRTINGTGLGTFAADITDMKPNTTYYVRAYATNEKGTSYGKVMNFKTKEYEEPENPEEPEEPENPEEPEDPIVPELPVVTTSEVIDITLNSAICGGEVIFDGNSEVIYRGVCWSIEQNPTTEDDKTIDGDGIGIYTSILSDLSQNTTYYIRAYAVNEVGTSYGEEICFTTLSTTGTVNGHDWVDLGLPSGVKWATCNVGATSPEEYGDYYAWGETETKNSYDWGNCSTMNVTMDDIAGNPQYDVARKKWGDSWRMPTFEELEELQNNCTWELTTENGINGYKVTGPNGNNIFVPAAGYRYGTTLNFDGYYGGYWSSKPHDDGDDSAFFLCFDDKEQRINAYYRSDGQSVRAVID